MAATLGILGLPGLLMSDATEGSKLNPVEDFTLLGMLARSRHVWSTSPTSGLGFDRATRGRRPGRERWSSL